MCPVCLLTTAGISILSGVITTSGLSVVAIKRTAFEPSQKKRKAIAQRAVQCSRAAEMREFKTQGVAR